jgi:hypothetical protein
MGKEIIHTAGLRLLMARGSARMGDTKKLAGPSFALEALVRQANGACSRPGAPCLASETWVSRTNGDCSRPLNILLASAVLIAQLTGCGMPGVPRPPSLKLPDPVTGLIAIRTADTVLLTWTMPRRTTDKLPLRGAVNVRVCRSVEQAPCAQVAELPFDPGQLAQYEDHLSEPLTTGAAQPLTYTVEVFNRLGHSAGVSNAAWTASGPAPEPMPSLQATVRADGVVLHWQGAAPTAPAPAGAQTYIRIHRKLLTPPKQPAAVQAATPNSAAGESPFGPEPTVPEVENLTVPESKSGQALDTEAVFDRTYEYRAERVLELSLGGHRVIVDGAPSDPVTVVTRDVFPPAVPTGLVALTVPEEKAIDLSWNPDSEPDLAGYIVYRRRPRETSFQRLSAALIIAPAFRDAIAVPGLKYAYSVSAIDLDGNESARSPEVEETLEPQ